MILYSSIQYTTKNFGYCRHQANAPIAKWVQWILELFVNWLNYWLVPTVGNNTVLKTVLIQFMQRVKKFAILSIPIAFPVLLWSMACWTASNVIHWFNPSQLSACMSSMLSMLPQHIKSVSHSHARSSTLFKNESSEMLIRGLNNNSKSVFHFASIMSESCDILPFSVWSPLIFSNFCPGPRLWISSQNTLGLSVCVLSSLSLLYVDVRIFAVFFQTCSYSVQKST